MCRNCPFSQKTLRRQQWAKTHHWCLMSIPKPPDLVLEKDEDSDSDMLVSSSTETIESSEDEEKKTEPVVELVITAEMRALADEGSHGAKNNASLLKYL
jgi:hypothetical protein